MADKIYTIIISELGGEFSRFNITGKEILSNNGIIDDSDNAFIRFNNLQSLFHIELKKQDKLQNKYCFVLLGDKKIYSNLFVIIDDDNLIDISSSFNIIFTTFIHREQDHIAKKFEYLKYRGVPDQYYRNLRYEKSELLGNINFILFCISVDKYYWSILSYLSPSMKASFNDEIQKYYKYKSNIDDGFNIRNISKEIIHSNRLLTYLISYRNYVPKYLSPATINSLPDYARIFINIISEPCEPRFLINQCDILAHSNLDDYNYVIKLLELNINIFKRFPDDLRLKYGYHVLNINGLFLKNMSNNNRKNKDLVLLAVSQNGLALKFADQSLRDDEDIVSAAIINNYYSLKMASKRLQLLYNTKI